MTLTKTAKRLNPEFLAMLKQARGVKKEAKEEKKESK